MTSYIRRDLAGQVRVFTVLAVVHTGPIHNKEQGVWTAVLALTGSYESLLSYAMFSPWIFYGLTVIGVLIVRRNSRIARVRIGRGDIRARRYFSPRFRFGS